MYIDLNCDMGESFGAYKLGKDDEVIRLISSANIACGFHAGDPNVMDKTVKMAKENGVGIGVHMGYPDLLGFGRRDIIIKKEDLVNYIIYQMGALQAFCIRHGVEIQHVKSHGSMGNMSYVNETVADAVTDAILQVMPDTMLFVIENTVVHKIAEGKGIKVVKEVFADRAYNEDGTLVSRSVDGAVIKNPNDAADQVLNMALNGKVKTINGKTIAMTAESICVHGDTDDAIAIVRKVKERLEAANVNIQPVGTWL
ncbi:LamB/YcsF family protein [Pseudogracilibacillus sp. SO10305]|uniref:LamB/YcsF family protein n=1 Tax=Pseudogracilibacillus sp. SO10305 TaxID=3098292 RepID=UPI00300DF2EE